MGLRLVLKHSVYAVDFFTHISVAWSLLRLPPSRCDRQVFSAEHFDETDHMGSCLRYYQPLQIAHGFLDGNFVGADGIGVAFSNMGCQALG